MLFDEYKLSAGFTLRKSDYNQLLFIHPDIFNKSISKKQLQTDMNTLRHKRQVLPKIATIVEIEEWLKAFLGQLTSKLTIENYKSKI